MSFADFARRYLPITHPRQLSRVTKSGKKGRTVSGFKSGDRVQNWTNQSFRPGTTGTVTRTWGEHITVAWDFSHSSRIPASHLLLIGSDEHREANARFGVAA